MKIKYFGDNSFFIDNKVKISINPDAEEKIETDIVISLDKNIEDNKNIKCKKCISWQGEYEIKDVLIKIISLDENNIFILDVDSFRICFLNNQKEKIKDDIIEKIGGVDMLCVSMKYDIGLAVETISNISPNVAIPYNLENNLEDFVKKMKIEIPEKISFFDFKDISRDDEKTNVVLLDNQK